MAVTASLRGPVVHDQSPIASPAVAPVRRAWLASAASRWALVAASWASWRAWGQRERRPTGTSARWLQTVMAASPGATRSMTMASKRSSRTMVRARRPPRPTPGTPSVAARSAASTVR